MILSNDALEVLKRGEEELISVVKFRLYFSYISRLKPVKNLLQTNHNFTPQFPRPKNFSDSTENKMFRESFSTLCRKKLFVKKKN